MRLYQPNFEENSIASVIAHIVFFIFVIIVADDGHPHPVANIYSITIFSIITLLKTYFIYFSQNKHYEELTASILILTGAIYWALLYFAELLHSPTLNHIVILLFVGINGIAYGGSLSFYKKPKFNYLFVGVTVVLPLIFTLFILQELKIPFAVLFILGIGLNLFYVKIHYNNWKRFITEKTKGDQYSQEIETSNMELEKALDEAKKANKLKGDFIATVSHEVRTPMNGIIGLSTLLYDSELNDEQKDFVRMIKKSADSLLGIINDILDFSKIESGQFEVDRSAFDIVSLSNEMAVIFGEKVYKENVELRVNIDSDIDDTVVGDSVRLRQILNNILSNAVKFTHEGYIKLSLTNEPINISTSMYKFKIEDTGIGIPEEKIEVIFNRFTQGDASTTRKYGGTGLGLAITKEIVELMNGSISVKSEPNVGTIFYLDIPFQINKKNRITTHTQNEEFLRELREQVAGSKILIVEDNIINQKVTQKMLEKTGCIVDTALDGIEAIEKVTSEKYDLVFMDIQMPNLSGVEATIKIRTLFKNEDYVNIIAMTANAMKGDRERYIDAGMDDYISKPFSQEKLYRLLQKWLIAKKVVVD